MRHKEVPSNVYILIMLLYLTEISLDKDNIILNFNLHNNNKGGFVYLCWLILILFRLRQTKFPAFETITQKQVALYTSQREQARASGNGRKLMWLTVLGYVTAICFPAIQDEAGHSRYEN